MMASFAYSILTTPLLFLIPKGAFVFALSVFIVVGVNYGAPTFLLRAMMADIADIDAAENNTERAGIMYSLLALTNKFGMGWAVGITFVILAWLGFDPKTTNTADAIEHMRMFYIALPVILSVLAGVVMLGYPLDEVRQRSLRGRGRKAPRRSPFGRGHAAARHRHWRRGHGLRFRGNHRGRGHGAGRRAILLIGPSFLPAVAAGPCPAAIFFVVTP